MKKLFLILSALVWIGTFAVHAAGPPPVLRNRYTTNTVPDATLLSATYFAPRTDGRAGTGTQPDPYDISTPSKLHALWNSIFSSAQNNKSFVFLPGSYTATNSLRLTLGGTNLHFYGYGATIVCTNDNQNFSGALFGNITTRLTNASWSGFDVDLGSKITFATPPNRVWNGLTCDGQDIVLRNLTFRNVASTGVDAESFGIILGATNGIIQNCRVLGMVGPYASAIVAQGVRITCSGNVVEMNDAGATLGFGLSPYCSDSTFAGNVFRVRQNALSVDNPGGASGQIFENNTFIGNTFDGNQSVRMEPTTTVFRNWVFSGNTFKAATRWLHIPVPDAPTLATNHNISFKGNFFVGNPTGPVLLNDAKATAISYSGNDFSILPTLNTGTNRYGIGNTLMGEPNDLPFLLPGLTPFGSLELWGGNVAVDTATGNRVTNYNRLFLSGGMTAATNTGVITVPRAGYYRVALSYGTVSGASNVGALIYTNGASTGIIARNYMEGGRNASAAGMVYLTSGATVDLRSDSTSNAKEASLWVEGIR